MMFLCILLVCCLVDTTKADDTLICMQCMCYRGTIYCMDIPSQNAMLLSTDRNTIDFSMVPENTFVNFWKLKDIVFSRFEHVILPVWVELPQTEASSTFICHDIYSLNLHVIVLCVRNTQ